jgi:hypothetical protein
MTNLVADSPVGGAEFSLDPAIGTGNWKAYTLPLEPIFAAAEQWKRQLHGIEKPWLCWNVSSRWCLLQQKLIRHAGWTPLVGFDPRVGPPPVIPEAILIDFNKPFQFPVMWPHFPLEFAFLFVPRLAFWHADLLCRLPVLEKLAALFSSLEPGRMAAVLDKGGRRNYLNLKSHRYWELCGCTTREASENQFYNGTGWWRYFDRHPKCVAQSERSRRRAYSYDSGVGIRYWKNNYNGAITDIDIRLVLEGHCSEIGARNYVSAPNHLTAWRNLAAELESNYSLDQVAKNLGIAHLLDPGPRELG